MPYFEGLDKFGFPEDPIMGDRSSIVGSSLPDLVNTSEGGWLMGGPNTGVDDAAGAGLFGLGTMMLLPGPTYAAAAAVGGRLGGAPGAVAGVVGYAAASLAVMGVGYGLTRLD